MSWILGKGWLLSRRCSPSWRNASCGWLSLGSDFGGHPASMLTPASTGRPASVGSLSRLQKSYLVAVHNSTCWALGTGHSFKSSIGSQVHSAAVTRTGTIKRCGCADFVHYPYTTVSKFSKDSFHRHRMSLNPPDALNNPRALDLSSGHGHQCCPRHSNRLV
jgi:hypothetical protein